MTQKSSYLLYGYFGAANFGDDILLYSAIQNIVAKDPDAKFIIRNYGDIRFLKEFSDRITSTDFENIHLLQHPTIIKILLLLRAYWTNVGACSTLVVGGGTLIHDKPLLKSTFLLTCLCLIAKIRGRSVIGIGLGTKTINTKMGRLLVGILIWLFDEINLRDKKSLAQCHSILPNYKGAALTSDLAYAIKWNKLEILDNPSKKTIAVTLVDYFLESSPPAEREKILGALSAALSSFIQDGYNIRLIPLQRKNDSTGSHGDESILKKIKLPDELLSQCHLFPIEPTAHSIHAAYDGVCLTVGMRFHSLIFSAMQKIPFVGLAHEPKIKSLCDEFSMPQIILDEITSDNVKSAMKSALNQTISPTQIENNRHLALKNFNAFNLSKAH